MTHELHNLTNLERISLDDMNARAAMLTRVDRKYVVPTDCLDELLALMNPATQILEIGGKIEQRYASCYFDTPELHSFMDTAHKRRRRYKVRTRSYLDSELAFLEVKTRGPRGHTVKKRMAYDFAQAARMELSREGRLWVAERLEAAQCFDGVDRVDSLVPCSREPIRVRRFSWPMVRGARRLTPSCTGTRGVMSFRHPTLRLLRPNQARYRLSWTGCCGRIGSGRRVSRSTRLRWLC